MKQKTKHYGFPRTHYNDHGLQTVNYSSLYSVGTEFYPRGENTISKISQQNENTDSTKKLNPVYTEVVSSNDNDTIDVTEVTITNYNNRSPMNQKAMNMLKQIKKTPTYK